MTVHALTAVSPIDGRYAQKVKPLVACFSEDALIRHRLYMMVRYAVAIIEKLDGPLPELTRTIILAMANIESKDVVKVHLIETVGVGEHKKTNHDVKACELYLRDRFVACGLGHYVERIHFGATSEDVNNIAYALMLVKGSTVLRKELMDIRSTLDWFASNYANVPMLARTHGQEATPTTLGKEFAVFARRLSKVINALARYKITVKLNSASGNYNALDFAEPHIDWLEFSAAFVKDLNSGQRRNYFELNEVTTQSESHDTYAELFQLYIRANTILLDLCQDLWRYISDHWLGQKAVEGEAGSSIMPHKVNPIDFENAEGNLGLANCLFEFFSRKLPVSRLQRDLSDSTVERNFGVAFGHSLIAYKAIKRGLDKIVPNEPKIREALRAHPEILAEAYQTLLRHIGYPDPYGALKRFTRGRDDLTLHDMHTFVQLLPDDLVPAEVKQRMLALTPETYVGLAPVLAVRS